MAKPFRYNFTLYKNCDWSVVLRFPYTITDLSFDFIIKTGEETDLTGTTEKLDSNRLKLSLSKTQINSLNFTNYEGFIDHTSNGYTPPVGELEFSVANWK